MAAESPSSAAPTAEGVAPAVAVPSDAAPPARLDADAPVAEAPKTVAETPSLLDAATLEEPVKSTVKAEEPKPAEAKPAEAPKAEEAKVDAKTEETPKPEAAKEPAPLAPVEYKYELPKGLEINDEMKTELGGVLDGFRQDPANVQPLVDFHVKALTGLAERMSIEQHNVFNGTRAQWREDLKKDTEFAGLGGAGYDTAFKASLRMRDLLVSDHKPGTPEFDRDSKAFTEFCRITGAGDHPVMWKVLHRAARYFDEPQAHDAPTEIRPAPTGRAPGGRRQLMYDNPTSPNNRG